jgi:hypothetical protein
MRRLLALATALVGPFVLIVANAQTQPVPAVAASTSASSTTPTSFSRKSTEEVEVEVITLEGEPEYDPQRFAVGLSAGGGWLDTRGSGAGAGVGNFGILGEFGLGQYGARAPLTIEVFASFALNQGSFSAGGNIHPNRFTELGGRLVWRPEGGLLADRWLSLGAGIVFTSWGKDGDQGNVAPGALLDVGAGLFEWKTRLVRYGVGLRAPVELSSHPGVGALGFFYAQVGLGG